MQYFSSLSLVYCSCYFMCRLSRYDTMSPEKYKESCTIHLSANPGVACGGNSEQRTLCHSNHLTTIVRYKEISIAVSPDHTLTSSQRCMKHSIFSLQAKSEKPCVIYVDRSSTGVLKAIHEPPGEAVDT